MKEEEEENSYKNEKQVPLFVFPLFFAVLKKQLSVLLDDQGADVVSRLGVVGHVCAVAERELLEREEREEESE